MEEEGRRRRKVDTIMQTDIFCSFKRTQIQNYIFCYFIHIMYDFNKILNVQTKEETLVP